MDKDAFMNLMAELESYIASNPLSPNYRALNEEKKVAIALYYLTDTGSLNQTANLFGVDFSTASKTIAEVCNAIKIVGPKYIKYPQN